MHPPGSDGRRTHEVTGAFAADGEHLPFLAPVAADGPPEQWLARVEAAMFASVKKHLFKAHARAARVHAGALACCTLACLAWLS